jgi:hypothetical protein
MSVRRLAAATAAILLLAGPAGALAQSAGDEQYEDPFAGQEEPTPAPVEEQGTLTEEAPGLDDTPPAPAPADTGDSEPEAAPSGPSLPATGGEAALIAMLGSGLLLTGTGLRLRLRSGARA